jgi:hypothetical protein
MSFYIASMLDTNSDQLTIFINTQAKVLEYTTIHRSLFEGYRYLDCYLVGGGGGGGSGADGAGIFNYAGGGGGSGYQKGYIPAIDNGPGGTGINYTLNYHASPETIDLTTYTDLSFILTIVGQGGGASTSGGTSSVVFYNSNISQIGPSIDAAGGIHGGDASSHVNGNGGAGYYAGGGGAGGYSGSSGGSGATFEGGYNGGAGTYDNNGPDIFAGAGAGPSGAGGDGAGCKSVVPCAAADTVGGDGGGANYLVAGPICGAKGTDLTRENAASGTPFTGQGGGGGAYYDGPHIPGEGGSGFIILRFHD